MTCFFQEFKVERADGRWVLYQRPLGTRLAWAPIDACEAPTAADARDTFVGRAVSGISNATLPKEA